MYSFFDRHSTHTFCNIGRYRYRSSSKLIAKCILLI